MINQPQQPVKLQCTNCFFETFKVEPGTGVFVLTCTNCATKYVMGIALAKIEAAKVQKSVQQ